MLSAGKPFDLPFFRFQALDVLQDGGAIKTGRKPNADIEVGHGAATLTHLGNIVARLGRNVTFDPKAEKILDDAEAHKLVRRTYRKDHWAVPKGV